MSQEIQQLFLKLKGPLPYKNTLKPPNFFKGISLFFYCNSVISVHSKLNQNSKKY